MSIKNQPVLIDFPKIVRRNNKTQAHLNWLKKHIKYFSLSAQLSSQYLRGEKNQHYQNWVVYKLWNDI